MKLMGYEDRQEASRELLSKTKIVC